MVVLSAFINYSFGYSLGTTELNGRIFGAVSVVAVGIMAVLPLRISMHWDTGRKATACSAPPCSAFCWPTRSPAQSALGCRTEVRFRARAKRWQRS